MLITPVKQSDSDIYVYIHVYVYIYMYIYIPVYGEGNCNPLQCSCLGNPMDRGAWWATVHGVTKSQI